MHSYQNALDFSINAMPTSCGRIGAGIQRDAPRGGMSVHSEFLFKLRDRLAMRLVSKQLSKHKRAEAGFHPRKSNRLAEKSICLQGMKVAAGAFS
jgi:hypothetical protein